MLALKRDPLLGQQAVVNNSFIGRVVRFSNNFPHLSIGVEHPITGIVSDYDPINVKLVEVGTSNE